MVADDGTTVDAGGAALSGHPRRSSCAGSGATRWCVGRRRPHRRHPADRPAAFHDEPTIEFLNKVGHHRVARVGNHEFDEGYKELLRIQHGGCHPVDGCQFPTRKGREVPLPRRERHLHQDGCRRRSPFSDQARRRRADRHHRRAAQGHPDIVTAEGIKDLEVRRRGRPPSTVRPSSCGSSVSSPRSCSCTRATVTAPARARTRATSSRGGRRQPNRQPASTPKIDMIFSGHSHQAYNCVVADPKAGNPRRSARARRSAA